MAKKKNGIYALALAAVLFVAVLAFLPVLNSFMPSDSTTPDVGWWKLNDATGSTVMDYSPHGNAGIVHGSPQFGYTFGPKNGMRFTGTGQYISVPDQAYFQLNGGPMTMSAWILSDAKDSAGHNWFTHGNWFMNQRSTNELACGFSLPAGQFVRAVVAASDWQTGTAIHILCTWNGSTVNLYKNGQFYASGTTMVAQLGQARDIGIGGDVISGQFWHGGLADVRLYSRILTVPDIQVVAGSDFTLTESQWTFAKMVPLLVVGSLVACGLALIVSQGRKIVRR